EIVLGKLTSRLATVVLVVLSALPIQSLIMLFGGIDPVALWHVQAATLLAMIYAGAHAIYFTAISKSPMGALVRTYWWMALWLLALPALVMIVLVSAAPGGPGPAAQFILALLLFINPVGVFLVALIPEAHAEVAIYLGEWFFPFTFVI